MYFDDERLTVRQAEVDVHRQQVRQAQETKQAAAAFHQTVESQFVNDSRRAAHVGAVLDLFSTSMHALLKPSGVYVGIVEDVDEAKRIRYVSASPGHEFMIGQALNPPAVTFDVFNQGAPAEDAEPQADDGAPPVEKPYEPKVFLVPNTLLGSSRACGRVLCRCLMLPAVQETITRRSSSSGRRMWGHTAQSTFSTNRSCMRRRWRCPRASSSCLARLLRQSPKSMATTMGSLLLPCLNLLVFLSTTSSPLIRSVGVVAD